MSAVSLINLPIDEKAYSYAKIYSAFINDEYQRKRAYASIVALYAFLNILEKTSLNIQKSMTLFRNPILNEQYEISDLYVNNWHLDVRVVTDADAVLVPKVHFESDIVPDFYIVVKVDSQLKNAELVGIADMSSDINETFDYNYYKIPFTSLITYDEFLEKVKHEKTEDYNKEVQELFEEYFLSLMDGGIDLSVKNQVLKHLFKSSDARTEFCCFTGFEMVSCNISKYPDVLDDKTLEIIGAQNLEDSKYQGKEQTIYIGNEELPEDTSVSSVDNSSSNSAVSDILDELFNDEEKEEIVSSQDNEFVEIKDDIADKNENLSAEEIQTPEENHTDTNDLSGNILADDSEEESINSDNNDDFEIIEDDLTENNKKEDLQLIDESTEEELNEIENIENIENLEEINEDNSDFVVINEEDDDSSSEIDLSQDISSPQEEVQKVIVDYDEYGEPIYSYITNINQEDAGTVLSEVEPIEDEEVQYKNEDNQYQDDEYSAPEEEKSIVSDDGENEYSENDEDHNTEEMLEKNNESFDNNTETVSPSAVNLYEQEIIPETEVQKEEDSNTEVNVEENNIEYEEEEDEQSQMKDEEYQNEEYTTDVDGEYEGDEYEKYEDSHSKSSLNPLLIIISVIVAVGLLGGGVFLAIKGLKNNDKTASVPVENTVQTENPSEQTNDMFEQPIENNPIDSSENNNQPENIQETQSQASQEGNMEQTPMPMQGTIPVPPTVRPSSNGDINKAIVNAFMPQGGVSLRGLNWFCTAELFTDPSFKKYLQDLDNKLKQNIKNNIMGVVQSPPIDSVGAKFAVDNNGNLQKVIISDSSGSEEIDNIVLQSIKESFEGEKSQILNDSNLKSDMYYLKVVIKL